MLQHDVREMAAIVAKLNLHFPRSGGLTNEQIVSIAEDWVDDFSEFPMAVIRQAAKLCRRDEGRKFFPTVGEFFGYCRVANVEYRRFVQKQIPAPVVTEDDEERKRQNGLNKMKELYAKMNWGKVDA